MYIYIYLECVCVCVRSNSIYWAERNKNSYQCSQFRHSITLIIIFRICSIETKRRKHSTHNYARVMTSFSFCQFRLYWTFQCFVECLQWTLLYRENCMFVCVCVSLSICFVYKFSLFIFVWLVTMTTAGWNEIHANVSFGIGNPNE